MQPTLRRNHSSTITKQIQIVYKIKTVKKYYLISFNRFTSLYCNALWSVGKPRLDNAKQLSTSTIKITQQNASHGNCSEIFTVGIVPVFHSCSASLCPVLSVQEVHCPISAVSSPRCFSVINQSQRSPLFINQSQRSPLFISQSQRSPFFINQSQRT